ncbi:CsbD family protein, partial [Acinetobacter baumannii]
MTMDTDRIKGAAKEFGGKLEEAAGHVTGNQDIRAEGVARQIEGKGQN